MLTVIAAVIFAIAFVLYATSTVTSAVFAPTSLLLIGLVLIALHLAGIGPSWRPPRRWRR